MTYQQTLDWMFGQLPMYQRQGKTAFKKDLTNTINLTTHLGNPHQKFKSVHVAGTNGKGSTASMIASILYEAGYKVGLYTSPHLKDFRERIKINGKLVSKQFVIQFIKRNKTFFEKHGLSFFEMTVGMAFDHFAKKSVDVAVVEVGLGGRLDSTNIITPEISVITTIGFDHMEFLGGTLPEIAFEKAGIIKEGVPVVVGEFHEETLPIFKAVAAEKNSHVILAFEDKEQYKTDLLGNYQQGNARTAVAVVSYLDSFDVNKMHVRQGLLNVVENTGLQGRWQQLQEHPTIICDTAHNREGLAIVIGQLLGQPHDRLHVVLGVVKDKPLEQILPLFPKEAVYYFCSPDIPRALDADSLARKALPFGLRGRSFGSVKAALAAAKKTAGEKDLIYVGGSTFVVAEAF